MLAQRIHRYGPPEAIERGEISVPRPQPGEALVRVAAADVGPWDGLVRSGQ